MSGAQGALPKECFTSTTYESKGGGENKAKLNLFSKEDEGGVEVEKLEEKVKDPMGEHRPVFYAGQDENKEDLGISGTG